ncbi:hypothetical protein ABZP36_003576 [Zizania latifolia]
MYIPRANLVVLAVVVALISFTVLDVQGNMENEYSLQKGNKKANSFHESSIGNSGNKMKREIKFPANLRTERQLTVATDGINTDGYASHRHVGAEDYCRFLKSIGKSCP